MWLEKTKSVASLKVLDIKKQKNSTLYAIFIRREGKSTTTYVEEPHNGDMGLYETSSATYTRDISVFYDEIIKDVIREAHGPFFHVVEMLISETVEPKKSYYLETYVSIQYEEKLFLSSVQEKGDDFGFTIGYWQKDVPKMSGLWFLLYNAISDYEYIKKRVICAENQ